MNKNKLKLLIGIFICLFILSSISLPLQNVLAGEEYQDDSDIETTLHSRLDSDSGEIQSELIPLGTYSFFDEPELDVGTFNHDLTQIKVSELQHAMFNDTLPSVYNKNDGLTGNFTVNTTDEIEEYSLSAPFDSMIQMNISYTRNYTSFESLSEFYDLDLEAPTELSGVCYYNNHFYIIDADDEVVKKYTMDFSSLIDTYSIANPFDYPHDIVYYNGYFYITHHDRLFKYDTNFVYISSYIGKSERYSGICYYDGYFYISFWYSHEVKKYTTDFSLIDTYDIGALGDNDRPIGIVYNSDDGYFYITDSETDCVYKYPTDFSSVIDVYDIGSMGGNAGCMGIEYYNHSFYIPDIDDFGIYQYKPLEYLFDNVYVNNFTYKKLGLFYEENYTCNVDSFNLEYNGIVISGYRIYRFDSTYFTQYDYINDLIILEQNLTIVIDLPIPDLEINMSIIVLYSSCEWKVPSEVDLTINGESVIDETYNSGYVYLSTYPSSLVITSSSSDIYFKLNITCYFTFTFDLEIISKTYLRKTFELLSDHLIYIDTIELDLDLDIKKIYLNNDDLGYSNPNYLAPAMEMDTGNIYNLEVILDDSIYRLLDFITNTLGSGIADVYLVGTSNAKAYSNINKNYDINPLLSSGMNIVNADFLFSDLYYTPYYISNVANNLYDYGYETSSYGEEDVNWSDYYYHEEANGTWGGESGGSGYENVYSEYFDALNGYMYHTYGDLDGYNSTYTVSDYLYMQNMFPSNLTFEDWIGFVLDYNSDYCSGSFSDGVFSSYLNTYSNNIVPENSSFVMNNGILVSNGSLWSLDGDYTTFLSEGGGGVDPYSFILDPNADIDVNWVRYPINDHYLNLDDYPSNDILDRIHATNEREEFIDHFGMTNDTVSGSIESIVLETYMSRNDVDISNDAKVNIYDGSSWLGEKTLDVYFSQLECIYTSVNWTGLSLTQSQINNLEVKFIAPTTIPTATIIRMTSFQINCSHEGVGGGGVLNFTSTFEFENNDIFSNETLDFVKINYGQKVNISLTEFSFKIWNFNTNDWDVINSTIETDFYDIEFNLTSDYYNASKHIILGWFGNLSTGVFELYIDKLLIEYNWTKTSGDIYADITKFIDFAFLNRYDTGFDEYQKLYNITIGLNYTFTNYTSYSYSAKLIADSNEFNLNTDGNEHNQLFSFIYDSAIVSGFDVIFNITNGLLELQGMNYTIFFECLDTNNRNTLYQFFRYVPSFSLDYLQTTRGNWILNFTLDFTESSDLEFYNFYNSIDYSLLYFMIYVNTENGWEDPVVYNYNTTQSNVDFSFNITEYIIGEGSSEFNDFYIEFYLAGNPSELIIDNMTLWDFDSDFYLVSEVWVDDALVVSHQIVKLYWRATDRYISHVIINQTYIYVEYNLFNITLVNDTLQTTDINTLCMGLYQVELTFYDEYGNSEWWFINYTVIAPISISIGYRNPVFTGENNTVSVRFNSEYSLTQIYYDNSTDRILEYDNSSYPEYTYEFNFTLSYSTPIIYNISVWVVGEYNDTFWVNVTGLSFILLTTLLDYHNFHSSYYQDDIVSIMVQLRDIFNNPLENYIINYTVEAPNSTIILDSSGVTNSIGIIYINITLDIGYSVGFYHINSSSTEVWKLQSFDVLPIERSVNAVDIEMSINSYNLTSNSIRVNDSNTFTMDCLDNSTFDLQITYSLNYTESIIYSSYLEYNFEFETTIDIFSWTITTANLTNYPTNFTHYYYNNLLSTNYVEIGSIFVISDLIGDTLYYGVDFEIDLRYLDDDNIQRDQITTTPTTESNTVVFKEYLLADRTFGYWYFENSYDINSISLYHVRTDTTISSFEQEGDNYYFEQSCEMNDQFEATINYKPNWVVNFTYIINNASYSYIKVQYKADLSIHNVTMVLDLRNSMIFDDVDNQGRDNYVLTIDDLSFTTSTKTLYITGTRTQHTVNPQTDLDSIQMNETITYNSEILTSSLVNTDPDWYISTSMDYKNATYGKMEIVYSADAIYTNVDLKTTITRNEMYADTVEVEGYQNITTLAFELSGITFTSLFQTTYIEGFRYLDETVIYTNTSYVDYDERYYWSSVSLSNHSIEIKMDWIILSSIVETNGTYAKIKIEYKSDIAINNVILQFSRTRNSIFGDIYEIDGYQNTTIIEFSFPNVNFTTLYQTTYVNCYRKISELNPTTNMTYLDFNEEYKWNSVSLSNHSIRINPHWNIEYEIISNNGTFASLNITYSVDFLISSILLKLDLKDDDLYAENWSNNAIQSLYTYILEIPNVNFTTSYQILNLTGVSSVPFSNFSSFINEDGFKISDEEWKITISDTEWKTIRKSNWEDIEEYIYGYLNLTKYSRSFIISNIEDDWELDGVHYGVNYYDISSTGYFSCEGFGSGITTAYLRFKTNPIDGLSREQTREQVIYKIKSKYDLEKVDFMFFVEEDERYNEIDMIKQLKKEIDCTDIIKYYSVEDRTYYMIMDMDLDEGTNKIIINYKIENASEYAWVGIIVGIAMIGVALIYISIRYKDDKIIDYIGLDKIVKLFVWIKKSERVKLLKKYRLEKKKSKLLKKYKLKKNKKNKR